MTFLKNPMYKYFKFLFLIKFIFFISLFTPLLNWGSSINPMHSENLEHISLLWILPFIAILLCIALFPLLFSHFWHENYWKISIFIFAIPMFTICSFFLNDEIQKRTFHELQAYISFIFLIASLFIISSGIYIKAEWLGTPLLNTLLIIKGSIIASFIGTTGASMLLIHPLIKANVPRTHKIHIFIFFIFVVSNTGGLLTPLGDPPLFLGYLKGVPFTWTLENLFTEWLFVNALIITTFFIFETYFFNKESQEFKNKAKELSIIQSLIALKKTRIEGSIQLIFLLGVILSIYFNGMLSKMAKEDPNFFWPHFGPQESAMGLMIILSLAFSGPNSETRKKNEFTWFPIKEVSSLFAGIFASMIPTLYILDLYGSQLGVDQAWEFFWMTGTLSSFLDNAPTYLVFLELAQSILETDINGIINEGYLLKAISSGAVFMGAMSYIGNAPNFMVFSIARSKNIAMPSFFGYMIYSVSILIPIFIIATFIFLVH